MLSTSDSEEKDSGSCCGWVVGIALAAIVVFIWEWLWPNIIPFTLFEFWTLKGSWADVLKTAWPILLWAVVVTFTRAIFTSNDDEENDNAEANFAIGGILSLCAGVFEEIAFRWIVFYAEIVSYKIINFLFFGWLGFGVAEWFYLHVEGPIANFITFGGVNDLLFHGSGWFVGAAMLTSNGKFRDGHAYQGCFGWINAWVIGMILFYIMFKHGIIASMVVHFVYDILIFFIRYIDCVIERRNYQ